MTSETIRDVDSWVEPRVASAMLGVTNKTLARLAKDGQLVARKLPSGHRRYDRGSVEALAAGGAAE